MKKFILGSGTFTLLSLASSGVALAQQVNNPAINCDDSSFGQFLNLCKLSPNQFIGKAINFIFVIAVVLALFFLIWGGIKWLMSQGDKNSVEGARNHIISAIVGLIVIFVSYFILDFVLKFFVGTSLSNINIPTL